MDKQSRLKRAVIKEELVALTGDYVKALILNQFIYWSQRVDDFDRFILEERERVKESGEGEELTIELRQGWIYKKAEELAEETMLNLSKSNMMNHIKSLVESEWIEQRRNPRNKMDKTYQYRVNLSKIQKALLSAGYTLEGYRVPLEFIMEAASTESRSSDLKLRSSKTELRNHETKLGGFDSELGSSDSLPRSSDTEQQYQRLQSKITTEITNTHPAFAAAKEISASIEPPPSQTDVCDMLQKLLGIEINNKTVETWRTYADDQTIIQVAELTSRDTDIKNVIGYINSVLRNGFTPPPKELQPAINERYASFYKGFSNS